ncbi:MAG: hypothetical protein HYT37_00390 [Candidatus Sungbacteria bacterium]|nr:hypothetical protein [Candidatus Sungbacteria bacterium]
MTWDYTKEEYERQEKADPLWSMERLILYGLGKKKLDPELLKKYLPRLRIPEDRKFFLELFSYQVRAL